jgi:hypothetical protein
MEFSIDQMLADLSEQTERALAAGFIATMIATILIYYGATVFGLKPLDLSALLAARMANNPMLGAMGHYVTGVIAYPAAFLVFWRVLPGSSIAKGLIWGLITFILGQFVLMPLVNGGLLADTFAWRTIVVMLVGHIVYGFVLTGVLGDISA